MRIGVIGAGAIGGSLAAVLDRAGHEVVVTARGGHLAAIRRDGLRLDGAWGEHAARVEAAETLPGGIGPGRASAFDLVILSTKALDAAVALETNRQGLSGARVLVVQNGLDGLDEVRRLLPDSPATGALAVYAARLIEPGRVTVTTGGEFVLGDGERPSALARELAAVLDAAGAPAAAVSNFVGTQWTKLLINHVNALPAITGLSVQECCAHPELSAVIARSLKESIRVGRMLGVRFAPLQGFTPALVAFLRIAPARLGALVPQRMGARMGPVPNLGSTLQSIRRGVPTEIDALNGAVVARGAALGVPTPVNTLLVELVHRVEQTGEHVGVAELLERVDRVRGAAATPRS